MLPLPDAYWNASITWCLWNASITWCLLKCFHYLMLIGMLPLPYAYCKASITWGLLECFHYLKLIGMLPLPDASTSSAHCEALKNSALKSGPNSWYVNPEYWFFIQLFSLILYNAFHKEQKVQECYIILTNYSILWLTNETSNTHYILLPALMGKVFTWNE